MSATEGPVDVMMGPPGLNESVVSANTWANKGAIMKKTVATARMLKMCR